MAILNAVADPIFVKDSQHRWILLNDAFCTFFGKSRDHLIGKSDYDYFPKEQADVFWEKDSLVYATGEVNENEEQFTDSMGKTRTILTRKARYFDQGAMFLVGTIRDVSEKKEAESQRIQFILEQRARLEAERKNELLEESTNRLRSILEALPVGVFLLGADGQILETNAEVNRIWGGQAPLSSGIKEYVAYRGWRSDTGKPLKPEDWGAAKALQEGKSVIGDVVDIQRFDGLRATILNSAVPLRNLRGEIEGAAVVASDITSLRKTQEELKASKEAAEAASKVKSEFLDIAAHELRTPLTPLTLLIEGAMKRVTQGKAVPLSHLEKVFRQIKRLTNLVDDLLNVSRLERGVLSLHLARADLNAIVKEAVDDIRRRAPERSVKTIFSREMVFIRVDADRIYQVLSNFLDNALKYTPEKSPIEVAVSADSTRWRVEVIDHGSGISEDRRKHLFSRFYRARSDETLRYPGLGLGLYICRRIAELHGGTVGLENRAAGSGSTFYLELPLVKKEEELC